MQTNRSKRSGKNGANTEFRQSVGLDQGSVDRLTWLQHTTKHLFGRERGATVVVRAALWHYAHHLSELLPYQGLDPEKDDNAFRLLQAESVLTGATAGELDALPAEQLKATPPRPYREIQREAYEARQARHRQAARRFFGGYRHEEEHDDE